MAGPKLSDIARELNDDPARWAPEIIGEAPNKSMSNPREMRFYKKGGLVVKLQGPKKGNWSHHGHDKFGDMLDLIMYIRGCSRDAALDEAKRMLGIVDGVDFVPKPKKSTAELEAEEREENEKRIRAARFIWSKSKETLIPDVDSYLADTRGISIHRTTKFKCVRSRKLDHFTLVKMGIEEEQKEGQPKPPVRFANGLTALVVAATKDDGSVTCVQQVIIDGLTKDKADVDNKKRSNGLMDQSAVRFGEPEDKLQVIEGPETGFSTVEATQVATWASLGASNFTRLPIPERVKQVVFGMELEPSRTGIAATLKAAHFWMAQGKDVGLAIPRIEGDPNDVHRQFGIEAVREDFANAVFPDRNPFRTDGGTLLSSEYLALIPVILIKDADDALVLWRSTGLPTYAHQKDLKEISGAIPEGAKRIIIVQRRDDPMPKLDLPEGMDATIIHLSRPLVETHKTGGGDAVRALIAMASPIAKTQLAELEELATMPKAPVIVVTGRLAWQSAKKLFPTAAAVGLGARADSATIDWSCLSGRQVYFAPAHRPDDILAVEQAAEDALAAGATKAAIFDWPLIVPQKTGWRSRKEVPEGYDLRWLETDGWTSQDARKLALLARSVLYVKPENKAA